MKMVRETRHLWVGNLPENIREDRIFEHFKRYGRLQSVKLLPTNTTINNILEENNTTTTAAGLCATVAFMDIKSASKAHTDQHKIDERSLTTQYYEPPSTTTNTSFFHDNNSSSTNTTPSSSSSSSSTTANFPPRSPRFPPHGSSEENFDRSSSSHFYRGNSSSSGGGLIQETDTPSTGYRGANRTNPNYSSTTSGGGVGVGGGRPIPPRQYRNGPPYPPSSLENSNRHHRAGSGGTWNNYEGRYGEVVDQQPQQQQQPQLPPLPQQQQQQQQTTAPSSPASSTSPPSSQISTPATATSLITLSSASASAARKSRHAKRRRGGARGSTTGLSDSEHSSGRSSSSSSSSSQSADDSISSRSSRSSSPEGSPRGHSRLAPPSHHNNHDSDDRRVPAICVRNLPVRSSDSSLKEGLFHEYKKHGKVIWVKVVGTGNDRYALVRFKKLEDVEKALEGSHDKLFFGTKIDVARHDDFGPEDHDFRPFEDTLDEYHPKATRTLFIGNLEKDITSTELRKYFEQFGEIVEIDIKKQGISSYAFCQYSDISAVIMAMRSMDGEHINNNRIKLGFGKSMPTKCVWVGEIPEAVSEKNLMAKFQPFGPVTHVSLDRTRGQALVFFEQITCAQSAVKELKGKLWRDRRLQLDFASRECQLAFNQPLEKPEQPPWPATPFDPRYEAASNRGVPPPPPPPRPAQPVRGNCRPNRNTNRPPPPPHARYNEYYEEFPARISRTNGGDDFEENNGGSYEQELRDYGYCQRERRPSDYTMEDASLTSGIPLPETAEINNMEQPESANIIPLSIPMPARRHSRQQSSDHENSPLTSPSSKRFHRISNSPFFDEKETNSSSSDLNIRQLHVRHNDGKEPPPPPLPPLPRTKHPLEGETPPPPLPPPPDDMKNLQKERASLQHQLEVLGSNNININNTNNSGNGVRVGENIKPLSRRPSSDFHNMHHHHPPPPPPPSSLISKRRKTECSEGDRPGTPLCDEKISTENTPSEPRKPRQNRPFEGPLELHLPKFAQCMYQLKPGCGIGGKTVYILKSPHIHNSSKHSSDYPSRANSIDEPRSLMMDEVPMSPSRTESSSDSECGSPRPFPVPYSSSYFDKQIRDLDERMTSSGVARVNQQDTNERFKNRRILPDLAHIRNQPSDIMKSLLAKNTIFDEDAERLRNTNEKFEPKDYNRLFETTNFIFSSSTPASIPYFKTESEILRTHHNQVVSSPITSPKSILMTPKPALITSRSNSLNSAPPPPPPIINTMLPIKPILTNTISKIPVAVPVVPKPPPSASVKGLQYPFPSHPPASSPVSVLPGSPRVQPPLSSPVQCNPAALESATSADWPTQTQQPPPSCLTTPPSSICGSPSVADDKFNKTANKIIHNYPIKAQTSKKEIIIRSDTPPPKPVPIIQPVETEKQSVETTPAAVTCLPPSRKESISSTSSSSSISSTSSNSLKKSTPHKSQERRESVEEKTKVKERRDSGKEQSKLIPANVGSKRRISSQDEPNESDNKRAKLSPVEKSPPPPPLPKPIIKSTPDRRDSKDSRKKSTDERSRKHDKERKLSDDKEKTKTSEHKISSEEKSLIKSSSDEKLKISEKENKSEEKLSSHKSSHSERRSSEQNVDKHQNKERKRNKSERDKSSKSSESKSRDESRSKSETSDDKNKKPRDKKSSSGGSSSSKQRSETDKRKDKEKDKEKDRDRDRGDKDKERSSSKKSSSSSSSSSNTITTTTATTTIPSTPATPTINTTITTTTTNEIQRTPPTSRGSSDSDSDETNSKKHSIFDIEEEPAYISMYDKVKARSTKNLQKQEEEKKKENLKEKFNQLKQSRAKREEKKRSTSYDEDSDSDNNSGHHHHHNQQQRNTKLTKRRNKFLISSSSDDDNDRQRNQSRICSDITDSNNESENEIRSRRNKQRNNNKIIIKSDFTSEDELIIKSQKQKINNNNIKSDFDFKSSNNYKDVFDSDSDVQQQRKPSIKRDELFYSSDDNNIVSNKKHFIDKFKHDLSDSETNLSLPKNKNKLTKQRRLSNKNMENIILPAEELEVRLERLEDSKIYKLDNKKCYLDDKRPSSVDSDYNKSFNKHNKKNKQHSTEDNDLESISGKHRSRNSTNSSTYNKVKKSKKESKQEKREEKMENIFGPCSDSSDHEIITKTTNKLNASKKWMFNSVYSSDSDDNSQNNTRNVVSPPPAPIPQPPPVQTSARRSEERRQRKKDKKERREKKREKSIEEDIIREKEKTVAISSPPPTNDIFNFSDEESAGSIERAKEKKKKRNKKSKEERRKHHKDSSERTKSTESSSFVPITKVEEEEEEVEPVKAETPLKVFSDHDYIGSEFVFSPEPIKVEPDNEPDNTFEDDDQEEEDKLVANTEKKSKLIPVFATEDDTAIHDTAVQSISFTSEPEPLPDLLSSSPLRVPEEKEDKPRTLISQEETEDAVAALLGERFEMARYSDEGEEEELVHELSEERIVLDLEPEVDDQPLPSEEAQKETQQAVQSLECDFSSGPTESTTPPQIDDTKESEDRTETPHSENDDLTIDESAQACSDDERRLDVDEACDEAISCSSPTDLDFSRPPKTPDVPAGYYQQQLEDKLIRSQSKTTDEESTHSVEEEVKSPLKDDKVKETDIKEEDIESSSELPESESSDQRPKTPETVKEEEDTVRSNTPEPEITPRTPTPEITEQTPEVTPEKEIEPEVPEVEIPEVEEKVVESTEIIAKLPEEISEENKLEKVQEPKKDSESVSVASTTVPEVPQSLVVRKVEISAPIMRDLTAQAKQEAAASTPPSSIPTEDVRTHTDDEVEDKPEEVIKSTPRRGGRSRRGGKVVATRGGVSTRRTARATANKSDEHIDIEEKLELSVTSPEQSNRGRKPRRGRKKKTIESDSNRNNDIYEFHDTDDEDLLYESKVTDKCQVAASAASPQTVSKPEEAPSPPVAVAAPEQTGPENIHERRESMNEDGTPRPRLIITIKSPLKDTAKVETREEFDESRTTNIIDTMNCMDYHPASPAANVRSPPSFGQPTRKSRRLQEKDYIPRNTIDDVIEDVIKGNFTEQDHHHHLLHPSDGGRVTTRRSGRGRHRASEERQLPTSPSRRNTNVISNVSEDIKPHLTPSAIQNVNKVIEPPKSASATAPVSSKTLITTIATAQGNQKIISNSSNPEEPRTLIDPVTGILTPMRESEEEGQYIPVTSTSVSVIQAPSSNIHKKLPITGKAATPITVAKVQQPPQTVVQPQPPPPSRMPGRSTAQVIREASPPTARHPDVGLMSRPPPLEVAVPTVRSPGKNIPVSSAAENQMYIFGRNVSEMYPTPPCSASSKCPSPRQSVPAKSELSTPILPPNKQHLMEAALQQQKLELQIQQQKQYELQYQQQQQKQMEQKMQQQQQQFQQLQRQKMQQQQQQQQGRAMFNEQQPVPPQPQVQAPPPERKCKADIPLSSLPPRLRITKNAAVAAATGVPPPNVPPLVQEHSIHKQDRNIDSCIVSHVPPPPAVSRASPVRIHHNTPQVMQAGQPVPAFETSMHSSSTGLLPPLPPPSHTAQVIERVPNRGQRSPPPAHQQGDLARYAPITHLQQRPEFMHCPPEMFMRAHDGSISIPPPYHHQFLQPSLSPSGPVRSPVISGMIDLQDLPPDVVRSPPLDIRRTGRIPPAHVQPPHHDRDSPRAYGGPLMLPPPPHNIRSPDMPPHLRNLEALAAHQHRVLPYSLHRDDPYLPRELYREPPPPAHQQQQKRNGHPIPGQQPVLALAVPPTPRHIESPPIHNPPPPSQSLVDLLQNFPIVWQGLLALKNDQVAVQMHYIFGNPHVASDCLPYNQDGTTPPLRISQRMRLEPSQIDGVSRKMSSEEEHCVLLALPCGKDRSDVLQNNKNMQEGFIQYLQLKQAAGIVNLSGNISQSSYVVHIFPSCDFSTENFSRVAPELYPHIQDLFHLLIIIATV